MRHYSKLWIGMFHTKIAIAVAIYSPISGMLIKDDYLRLKVRLVCSLGLIVWSAFMRFYR